MKKIIALALAGAMVFSMPVMAAGSPSAKHHSSKIVEETSPQESAEAEVVEIPSSYVEGIPAATYTAAAQEGKTVGEYINNAVESVPGLENAAPIAQGGHVILNGAPSNVSFTLDKPQAATVTSAKQEAEALGGEVLTVVDVESTVGGFATAEVNFYMPGVTADNNVAVRQLVNGAWEEVGVAEVREDHVVVEMTGLGTLMFVQQ